MLTGSPQDVSMTAGEMVEDGGFNMAAKDESATAAASVTNDPKLFPVPAPQDPKNNTSHEDKDHDEMVEAEEDTVIY